MIRRLATALVIVVAAAAAAPAQQPIHRTPVEVALRGFQRVIKLDTLIIWDDVEGTPGATWSAARKVLDSLKVPIHYADSVRGVLHADFHRLPGKVAGRQRSWTVRCGRGLAGDYADTWRVSMAYIVYVEPGKEGKTRLGTALIGGADPVEGTSKESMPCPSTGNLENLLYKAVQLRVL